MNCRQARRCLSPYLDSELDAGTTFAISEHLRVCEACRKRFDAEREVERMIATSLRPNNIPDALWKGIVRPIGRRAHGGRRLYVSLAAAAAIALVAWTGWSLTRSERVEPHWLVREFLADTEGGRPFATSAPEVSGEGMTMRLRPFADLIVSMAGEDSLTHAIQMVRLDAKTDEEGAEYVELRLNCCGEPVILRAARRDQPGRLRELIGADASRLASLSTVDKVEVAEREVGAYVVVAVSRHPMSDLLSGMKVQ